MGEMAEFEIDQHIDAIIQGDECPYCGFSIFEAPGCLCDEDEEYEYEDAPMPAAAERAEGKAAN